VTPAIELERFRRFAVKSKTSRRSLLIACSLASAIACSSSADRAVHESTPHSLPAECDDYVTTYRACLGALGPETRRLAEERGARIRERLVASVENDATRETTRLQCAADAKALHHACR
jgi:hypothetical protein